MISVMQQSQTISFIIWHVVDLAFYLCGKPDEISCYTTGGLNWHSAASVFAGAGITKKNVLFSYNANWGAPGRWGVEIMTKKIG